MQAGNLMQCVSHLGPLQKQTEEKGGQTYQKGS